MTTHLPQSHQRSVGVGHQNQQQPLTKQSKQPHRNQRQLARENLLKLLNKWKCMFLSSILRFFHLPNSHLPTTSTYKNSSRCMRRTNWRLTRWSVSTSLKTTTRWHRALWELRSRSQSGTRWPWLSLITLRDSKSMIMIPQPTFAWQSLSRIPL